MKRAAFAAPLLDCNNDYFFFFFAAFFLAIVFSYSDQKTDLSAPQ